MDKCKIESAVNEMRKELWANRRQLWPLQTPHPIFMLDPEYAARVLGIEYELYEELGHFGYRGKQFEIAGLVDRQAQKIAVSRRFPLGSIRFTGAHELGHYLLHPQHVMHRDRPFNGETRKREPKEMEADYFAACYLMPRKLVTNALEATFLTTEPLVINDATAFWLCPSDPDSLLNADHTSLTCAMAVASSESYSGNHFISLSKQFQVSTHAMAIRLKELRLIQQ